MKLPELDQFENDTAETRLKYTVFVVECGSSNDQHELWARYSGKGMIDYTYRNYGAKTGEHVYQKYWVDWEQISDGWIVTVGKDNKRPVCISVHWARINGRLVMFYYPISQIVNHPMIEKWIEKHFDKKYDKETRRAFCDASDFSSCLLAIKELNENGANA